MVPESFLCQGGRWEQAERAVVVLERLGNGEWMEQNAETSSGHGSPGGSLGSIFLCHRRESGGMRKGVEHIGK